jgi:NAD-dependent SIR2 family protein deacetylase
MKTAIFLGAGTASAEGAPTQSKLFMNYFELIQTRNSNVMPEMESELRTFFFKMFNIDIDSPNLSSVEFPTFEEVLGILDLADMRNESFRNFSNLNIAANSGRLKRLRLYLILLLADILHEKLKAPTGLHIELVKKLKEMGELSETIFITTNYDILIDNAIINLFPDFLADYGIEFINYNSDDMFPKPHDKGVQVFKLHGSLNWLYCPTCNSLKLTPAEKGVVKLITDPAMAICDICETIYSPLIVPPTFFKDISNVFLGLVWNKVEKALHHIDHIIFCGYSFPDADIHVKYLIKRIQSVRATPITISVLNNYDGKNELTAREEEVRYRRFLGIRTNYTNYSFENFVENPNLLIS